MPHTVDFYIVCLVLYAIFTTLLLIINIVNGGFQIRDRAKKPLESLKNELNEYIKGMNARIDRCEERLDKHDGYIDNDNKRLKEQEEATNVLLYSMLAIMTCLKSLPMEDTGAVSKLDDAVTDINNFLLERRNR